MPSNSIFHAELQRESVRREEDQRQKTIELRQQNEILKQFFPFLLEPTSPKRTLGGNTERVQRINRVIKKFIHEKVHFAKRCPTTCQPGLVAKEVVKASTRLLSIPYIATISAKVLQDSFKLKSQTDRLAFAVFSTYWTLFTGNKVEGKGWTELELYFGDHSALYAAYVDTLPPVTLNNINLAFRDIFDSAKAEGGFAGGYLPLDFKKTIAEKREHVTEFLNSVGYERLRDELSTDAEKDRLLLTLLWAFSQVSARCFGHDDDLILAPFLDLANHASSSRANVKYVINRRKWSLVVIKDLKPGDEILVDYDEYKSNRRLVVDYGFTDYGDCQSVEWQEATAAPAPLSAGCLIVQPNGRDRVLVSMEQVKRFTRQWAELQVQGCFTPNGDRRQALVTTFQTERDLAKAADFLVYSLSCLAHEDLTAPHMANLVDLAMHGTSCYRCQASYKPEVEPGVDCVCYEWLKLLLQHQHHYKLKFTSPREVEASSGPSAAPTMAEMAESVFSHMGVKAKLLLAQNVFLGHFEKHFLCLHLFFIEQHLLENYNVDVNAHSIDHIYHMVIKDRPSDKKHLNEMFLNEIALFFFWRFLIKYVLANVVP